MRRFTVSTAAISRFDRAIFAEPITPRFANC